MGSFGSKSPISDFQKNKYLHEFNTFFDFNKDGVLELRDLDEAREKICKMSGWSGESEKYSHTKAVFTDIWRYLQDDGDADLDGRITREEWLAMWERLHLKYLARLKEKGGENDDSIPDWLERYIQYKFDLLDRTGDGEIDLEEFEYVLRDFGVPPKDAKTAYLLFSENNANKIHMAYFRKLSIQYFRSNDQSELGNFITGRLDFS